MTGKELIFEAFKGNKTERIPWAPFVGCHGAKLIGVTATEYLQSSEHIIAGINKSIERYSPDGIPVTFDLQIEAEAMGCRLAWADENPPAVVSHPLTEDVKLEDLKIPKKSEGRIPLVLKATEEIRKQHPDIALYGLITGPFTLALHLIGADIFMKMFEDEDYIHRVLEFTTEVGKAMSNYLIEAGCDIVAVVDPMTSQIGPDQFRQFITKPVSKLFSGIREKGAYSSFFVCGHAQQNIEAMCECKPDNVSIDENIPLDFVRSVCEKYNISFGGNLKLTVVLLMGKPEDARKNVMECIEAGGNKGFVLAPGCDLPMATPPENLEAVAELILDPYKQEVEKSIPKTEMDMPLLDMSEYGKTDKVIVDIITLDSESCAPCQYMVEAVKNIMPEFDGIVEWREHSVKEFSAVTFMSSLMVKNIPTICIDGKIEFVSQIPPKHELIQALQKRINEKLRMKINVKKGEVLILGKTIEECEELKPLVKKACEELGGNVEVVFITDKKEIMSYGVSSTPAIVVNKFQLKSQGNIPSAELMKEWMKEIV